MWCNNEHCISGYFQGRGKKYRARSKLMRMETMTFVWMLTLLPILHAWVTPTPVDSLLYFQRIDQACKWRSGWLSFKHIYPVRVIYYYSNICSIFNLYTENWRVNALTLLISIILIGDASQPNVDIRLEALFDLIDFSGVSSITSDETVRLSSLLIKRMSWTSELNFFVSSRLFCW